MQLLPFQISSRFKMCFFPFRCVNDITIKKYQKFYLFNIKTLATVAVELKNYLSLLS